MIHTAQEITDIAKQIKARIEKEYDIKLNHSIEEAIYDTERQCWVVIAVSKLFEQENLFSYFISVYGKSVSNFSSFSVIVFSEG